MSRTASAPSGPRLPHDPGNARLGLAARPVAHDRLVVGVASHALTLHRGHSSNQPGAAQPAEALVVVPRYASVEVAVRRPPRSIVHRRCVPQSLSSGGANYRAGYHLRVSDVRARPAGPRRRLASRARAPQRSRRGGVADRSARRRRRDLGGRPRLPVRPCVRPRDGRAGRLRRPARGVLRAVGTPAPAPRDPTTLEAVLDEFSTRVAPHTVSAYHPRSFGYFTPPPLLASVAGEVLAQVAQQGIDIWHAGPIGAFVEEEVLALAVRPRRLRRGQLRDPDLGRRHGELHRDGARPRRAPVARPRARRRHAAAPSRASASTPRTRRTSRSAARSMSWASRPRRSRSSRPTTTSGFAAARSPRRSGAIARPACCRSRSRRSRAQRTPARSTRSASSPTSPIAKGLWLHVDAAYGAAARLSARDAGRVPDLERAQSVTVDPHKWLFQAYDIGGLMVRERAVLGRGLRRPAAGVLPRRPRAERHGRPRRFRPRGSGHAVGHDEQGADDDGHGSADQLNFWRLGFEGTRRWRALKLWLSWKHVGSEGFARLVEANDDLAAHLAARIAASDDFEALPADPPLSVVCFRHLPGGRPAPGTPRPPTSTPTRTGSQAALEASGEGWLTTTRLRGATYLRAGILNTQSTVDDIDDLLELLRRLASRCLTERADDARGLAVERARVAAPGRHRGLAAAAPARARRWSPPPATPARRRRERGRAARAPARDLRAERDRGGRRFVNDLRRVRRRRGRLRPRRARCRSSRSSPGVASSS